MDKPRASLKGKSRRASRIRLLLHYILKNCLKSRGEILVFNNTNQKMSLGKHISETEAKMKFHAEQACMQLEAIARNSGELTGQARHECLEKLRMVKEVGRVNVRNSRLDALMPLRARDNPFFASQIELNQCESVIESMRTHYENEIEALFKTIDFNIRASGPIAKPPEPTQKCAHCSTQIPRYMGGSFNNIHDVMLCGPCRKRHYDEVDRKNSFWGKMFG